MANNKQLVCLDEICNDIIKDESNKSEYIRKAIKFFNKNKNESSDSAETTTQKGEVTWH